MTEVPEFLREAIATTKPAQSADTLRQLRDKVAELRDTDHEIENLNARLTEASAHKNRLEMEELPALLDGLGVPSIELAADGNYPGVIAKAQPFYRANIAADWPDDQRQRGFDYLDSEGAGELVKVAVTLLFAKGERAESDKALALLRKAGFEPTINLTVPWNTLTAWLKEQVERYQRVPKLDLIGGQVGRVVKLKPKKD